MDIEILKNKGMSNISITNNPNPFKNPSQYIPFFIILFIILILILVSLKRSPDFKSLFKAILIIIIIFFFYALSIYLLCYIGKNGWSWFVLILPIFFLLIFYWIIRDEINEFYVKRNVLNL